VNAFEQKNTELIKEFTRYVREHPKFAEQIPNDAIIILQLEGDEEFKEVGNSELVLLVSHFLPDGVNNGQGFSSPLSRRVLCTLSLFLWIFSLSVSLLAVCQDLAHHFRERVSRLAFFFCGLLDDRAEQARLALEKSLGVVRLAQVQVMVVEVMADFMQQSAQESPEGNNLTAFCRAHPDLNGVVVTAASILGV